MRATLDLSSPCGDVIVHTAEKCFVVSGMLLRELNYHKRGTEVRARSRFHDLPRFHWPGEVDWVPLTSEEAAVELLKQEGLVHEGS